MEDNPRRNFAQDPTYLDSTKNSVKHKGYHAKIPVRRTPGEIPPRAQSIWNLGPTGGQTGDRCRGKHGMKMVNRNSIIQQPLSTISIKTGYANFGKSGWSNDSDNDRMNRRQNTNGNGGDWSRDHREMTFI